MEKIVECVPNFSEGRDKAVINAISGAIESVEGVRLLNVDPGEDFNRTVYTFVGSPDDVVKAAFAAMKIGTALIDMTKHKGEHARMGAADVVPFIPIKGVNMEECVEISKKFGKMVSEELGIPIFLYARSAQQKNRVRLPDIRKGEYEALEDKFRSDDFKPDFGESVFIPKSGATATGARPILIAYNINLNTNDKKIASKIAAKIRTSGVLKRDGNGEKIIGPDGKAERIPGLFKEVQAGGMMYNEDIAQVSMNLLDYTITGMHEVYEACRKEAKNLGAEVTGSEIVGLVPMDALLQAARYYMSEGDMDETDDEEEIVRIAVEKLGLSQLYKFVPEEKIIEYMVEERGVLVSSTIDRFLAELSSNSPAPGGGSVSALSGAMGAALIEMVCQLTVNKEKFKDVREELNEVISMSTIERKRLTRLIDEDTEAFNDVIKAFRMPKESEEERNIRSRAIQEGYKKAITTPMETARRCLKILELSKPVAEKGNPNSVTDAGVGADMAASGLEGAILNIRINLGSVKNEKYIEIANREINSMMEDKERLHQLVRNIVNDRI